MNPRERTNEGARRGLFHIRFSMKTMLVVPLLFGVALVGLDYGLARLIYGDRPVAVQFMAVDAQTSKPVANATLILQAPGRTASQSYPMGGVSNTQLLDFGIKQHPDSWFKGTGRADYGGWVVRVQANGYQTWESDLDRLVGKKDNYHKTLYPQPPILIPLRRSGKPGI